MNWRYAIVLALVCSIGGCAPQSAGVASGGFLFPSIAAAYRPLDGTPDLILVAHGAATIVAPGIAATNAHNSNLVASAAVIGVSTDYDLLFFRMPGAAAPPMGPPSVGETVVAYGQGGDSELREAHGIVRSLAAPVEARCPQCPIQQVFTFAAPAGNGFSGGPVADASDGRIVGIVFGYNDMQDGSRLMYAYDMDRVAAELAKITGTPAQKAAQRP
jgi:S1-C subfamily serine protease